MRFASDPDQPVAELMTKDNLVTVPEGTDRRPAKRLLHQNRIEKLLVTDGDYRCIGLITVKDIEKAAAAPRCLQGRAGPDCGWRRRPAPATRGWPGPRALFDAWLSTCWSSTPPMVIRKAC